MDKDLKSASTGDTSPLTTSTESESFDTWTVITDNNSKGEVQCTPPTPEKSDDDEEVGVDAVRVEVLQTSDDLTDCSRFNDTDDLSDGISIISESESAGRITPHPELRKHLSDLNMRFINPPDRLQPSASGTSELTSCQACSEGSSYTFHRVEPLLEQSQRSSQTSTQLIEPTEYQPTLRFGLRGLFYIGALLGVLAFISRIKYDAWEANFSTKTGLLTQKINDLELKNNLMRAEIDILTKQVNYLTTLSENQKYTAPTGKQKPSPPREKKIKAWPGNGNTIEEVEISPKDLKKPFKCDGHNNVDIAGMCIELPLPTENVIDSVGGKVREVIDENEYFTNFEQVVDKMARMVENPFGETSDQLPTENPPTPQSNGEYIPHEHQPNQYDNRKYEKHEKRDNYKKHSSRTDRNDSGESKEREKFRRDKSREERNDSDERFKKSKDYKKYDKRSSSEYENAKREADGQWHEKLMQHRENARKNTEKYRQENNWYIERGDSREQARIVEQKYRGSGQR